MSWNKQRERKLDLRMKSQLLILILSGLSALPTPDIKEYYYVKKWTTWAEAQKYCRENFTDLATVNNQEENNKLLKLLQDVVRHVWIGLYDDLTRWKWALGNSDFNNDTDYSNWKKDEPNNKKSMEKCTVMSKSGSWCDFPCWQKRPAVCYNEQGPTRYILEQIDLTWYQAKKHCRSKYTDLVSVRNRSENKLISSLLSQKSWIGLHRKTWDYWSNQIPVTFTNWNTGQPDNRGENMESCVLVKTITGKWLDSSCEKKHGFICQNVQVAHKKTFKLRFRSVVNINDPAVELKILEQLQDRLKTNGSDFKLRWIKTDGQIFHKEQKRKLEEGSGF